MNTMPPIGAKVVLGPTADHADALLRQVLTTEMWAARMGKVTATVMSYYNTDRMRVILKDITGLDPTLNRYWWPVECMELDGYDSTLGQHFI